MNQQPLNQLLNKTGLWRASSIDYGLNHGISSGFPVLDQYLPGRGWPSDGLVELLHDQPGIGEYHIISAALAQLSQQGGCLLWVAPPYIPYAPALAQAGIDLKRILVVNPESHGDRLWVLERALASQACAAVLAWPGNIKPAQLRRLQLASKSGKSLGILYRPIQVASQASAAELRIQLQAADPQHHESQTNARRLSLKILKRKGGWATDYFNLDLSHPLDNTTQYYSEPAKTEQQVDLAFVEQPASNHHAYQ